VLDKKILSDSAPEPQDLTLYFFMCANFSFEFNDRDTAKIFYEKCINTDPVYAATYNDLGVLEAETGNEERAIELFSFARNVKTDFADPACSSENLTCKGGDEIHILFVASDYKNKNDA
jgi:tetratricopeptide (TPR) repeat protein